MTLSYADRVNRIEVVWEPAGLASADAHGIPLHEAMEALLGDGPVVERQLSGELLLVARQVASGRIILLTVMRLDRFSVVQRIIGVRELPAADLEEWRKQAK
jgi:hypothetical protein